MSEKKNADRIFVAKPKGRRPLGRHRHRWEDTIKIDVKMRGVDWIDLAQDMAGVRLT
jgi:hypothetical protein